MKSSSRKAIKKDLNPLYGVDYDQDDNDKNRQSTSADNYDYMGN